MVTNEELTGHAYGEPMDYVCPECNWRTTRHWPPPKPHCPECGEAALRQEDSETDMTDDSNEIPDEWDVSIPSSMEVD